MSMNINVLLDDVPSSLVEFNVALMMEAANLSETTLVNIPEDSHPHYEDFFISQTRG